MADKHNLGTTCSSSQAQGVVGSETLVDRFSTLPNEILLHIMSSLLLKDLGRLRGVSKRCRQLCLAVPSLNIHGSATIYKRSKLKRMNLLNYVDRFFMQRGNYRLRHLRIEWTLKGANSCDEKYRIITWIHTAVGCNIKELELVLYMKRGLTFELPSRLLRCSTLKTLKVDLNLQALQVPPFGIPSTLRHLRLRNITISEEVLKWISCLQLKELKLEFIHGIESVTIESPSLEMFHLAFAYPYGRLSKLLISGDKLEDIDVTGPFIFDVHHLLKIVAPNLRRLRLIGYMMNQLSLGRFMCLEKAELFLYPTVDDYVKLLDVLSSIPKTTFLHLDENTIQVLRHGPVTPVQWPLQDISCFRAYVLRMTDDIIPSIVHLLRGMPNLNTLFIGTWPSVVYELSPKSQLYYRGNSLGPFDMVEEDAPGSGYNKSDWESDNLACIDQLEEVRLELSKGSNEVEFARYILKNAKNLKKMVILHTYHQSPAVEMIKASNRRSGDARVRYLLQEERTGHVRYQCLDHFQFGVV